MKLVTTCIVTFLVVVYAVIGGVVFHVLEKDMEKAIQQDVNSRLASFLANNTCMTAADMVRVQQLVELMFVGGLRFDADGGTVINGTRWDYETSIFVSIELLATVGYPKAAPRTTEGRVFAIFFAFIGIPAFLLSAIGLGKLLNLAAEALIRLVARLCRQANHHDDDDDDDDGYWSAMDGRPPARMPRSAVDKFHRRRAVYRTLVVTVVGAVLFVFVPSAIFMQVEQWTYWEAVYYCTITLITIGFGDFVPGYGQAPLWLSAGWYRLAVGCYIVIVIGWFTGVIASFRAAIYAFAHKAESRIIGVAVGVFHTTTTLPQPELYVSQTGNTSIVNIQPSASDIKDALRYPHNCLQHCDITALPRTAAPTNFGHDAYNSQVLTSNVRVFNSR